MSNLNPLLESYGEYPEYDDMLNSWFFSLKLWWHEVKQNFTFFKSCKVLSKETAIVNSVIKGLNIKVHAYADSDRNAFVIPGFYVGCEKDIKQMAEKHFDQYPKHIGWGINDSFMAILMSQQLQQLVNMRKFKVSNDPKNKGKKIITFKNVTTPISVFATYGLLQSATPEQRKAIYLHEIGHWVDCAKNIPEMILKRPEKESCFLYYLNCLERFGKTRYQELEADAFAKMLGYGPELISALDGLVSVRKQVALRHRIGDWMSKCAIEAFDKDEENGMTTSMDYPSMKTRKEYLSDDK